MIPAARLGLVAVIVTTAGILFAGKPAEADAPRPALVSPADYRPATSCSSSGCHGGQEVGKKGSENTTWTAEDPHARAHGVLYNAESRRMAKELGLKQPAHLAETCLACHAVPNGGPRDIEDTHAGGVSCDGCHGPSGKWVSTHFLPGWKALPDAEKAALGFANTKNLASRVRACAGCHVGEPGRDVNHDLIAAGHPRLAFEPARFHAIEGYTKHWKEVLPAPAFETRVWFVGQVVTLRMAVAHLAARATKAAADASAPWPELAESSCYSCHKSLTQKPSGGPASNGLAPWQTWHGGLADALPQLHAVLRPGTTAPTLAKFADLAKRMKNPRTAPADVAAFAGSATAELDAWIDGLTDAGFAPVTSEMSSAVGRVLTASALADGKTLKTADWDAVAQHYLGLAAAYSAAGGAGGDLAVWKAPLADLHAAIRFPASKGTARVDSPRDYDPAAAATALAKLHTLTHTTTTTRAGR